MRRPASADFLKYKPQVKQPRVPRQRSLAAGPPQGEATRGASRKPHPNTNGGAP